MAKPFVNLADVEGCELPDLNKVVIGAGEPGTPRPWKMFHTETSVD